MSKLHDGFISMPGVRRRLGGLIDLALIDYPQQYHAQRVCVDKVFQKRSELEARAESGGRAAMAKFEVVINLRKTAREARTSTAIPAAGLLGAGRTRRRSR